MCRQREAFTARDIDEALSEMKIVMTFDVVGTIETSSGPVTVARMNELAHMGVDIWIVSPSGLSPNRRTTDPTTFPEMINGDRMANLQAIKKRYRDSEPNIGGPLPPYFWFYVSDNKDYDAAKQAGFSY